MAKRGAERQITDRCDAMRCDAIQRRNDAASWEPDEGECGWMTPRDYDDEDNDDGNENEDGSMAEVRDMDIIVEVHSIPCCADMCSSYLCRASSLQLRQR
jgi:hypothetical protein